MEVVVNSGLTVLSKFASHFSCSIKVYNEKKKAAEQQLDVAKEMCEKLKKKRMSLVGAFVSTHSGSIIDVDRCDMCDILVFWRYSVHRLMGSLI